MNFITAFWVYIGRINADEGSWIASLPAKTNNDPLTLAVLANYFFANTVTTVGYGDITLTAPSGFQLSRDSSAYSNSLTIPAGTAFGKRT
ncbi:MAG: hypothetical protein EOO43_26670, partial [Flavobacterium sp.]